MDTSTGNHVALRKALRNVYVGYFLLLDSPHLLTTDRVVSFQEYPDVSAREEAPRVSSLAAARESI